MSKPKTGWIDSWGYRWVTINGKQQLEHKAAVEQVLGRALKGQEQVHHLDLNPSHNENTNYVLCPSREYHALLHHRTEALVATGDPNKRKCAYCKSWDSMQNLKQYKGARKHPRTWHASCEAAYQRKRRTERKKENEQSPSQEEVEVFRSTDFGVTRALAR